jgi:hypothetical protein
MVQFVVLLAIMALWALTSLLSREAQPLPPRQARGPGGQSGLRPPMPANRGDGLAPSRSVAPADRTGVLDRGGPSRWGEAPPAARPAPGRGLGVDDGIVILEPDSRSARPQGAAPSMLSSAASRRATPARRGTRGRLAASTNTPKPAEPGRPRALTSLVTQSMAQKRNRPLEITPLSGPLAPINSPLTQISTGAKIEHPGSPDAPPAFTSESLRAMLANPTRLREVALLTELLQPPVALRRARRTR